MSSGSEQHSASPKREEHRSSSRSRSREKRPDREHHHRDRDRKIKIKVPELTVSLYSFKHFNNLQSERVSSQTLQKAYDKYKKDWQQRQNEEFLKQYKKDAWFSEKYDPEVLDLLERDRKDNCKKLHEQFIFKLSNGFYDRIDLTARDPNDLGIVQKFDEDDEQNSGLSYVLSQAYDVHVNSQTQIHNEPYFGFDQNLNTLFIKSVPRSISRYDIRSVAEKLEGYKTLTMSDPVKKNNLTRYCWIDFEDEQSCNKAVLSLSGLMIKNETLSVTKSATKMKRIKILKNYPSSRREKDVNTMTKLIQFFDEEVGIETNPLLQKEIQDSRVKMDLYLLYLRKVHAFDYFTSSKYENQRILTLKVSSAFLRIEADYEELQNIQTVFKKIQQKAEERIEKSTQAKDYMGILREQMEIFIRQTEKVGKDQQKEVWKCMYCDKKFKTCEFLSKHMIAKHEDIKFKKIQSVMERLYLEDPLKITFSSLGDRDQRYKKHFNPHYRMKRRQYRDFDEPEPDKSAKTSTVGAKQMINFLDI